MAKVQLCEICGKEVTDKRELHEMGETHFACRYPNYAQYKHDVELYMYKSYGLHPHQYDEDNIAHGWSNRDGVSTACELIYDDVDEEDRW